jgi:hypothetical protein
MWTWTLVRFVHLAAAAVWLGMQVTLAVLVQALRRMLPAEQMHTVVRGAGRSLAIAGGAALAAVAASGVALSRRARIAASVLMLSLTLAAVLAGAWLAES